MTDPRYAWTPGATGPMVLAEEAKPETPGEMTKHLYRSLNLLRGGMLRQSEWWNSMNIVREAPHVERLWTQVHDIRIYLHCLHTCDVEPLFHPHPWPSAMMVVDGQYQMRMGYGAGWADGPGGRRGDGPREAARFMLGPKSIYEMSDPLAWHSVRPWQRPVYSVMVSGEPWEVLSATGPIVDDRFVHQPLSKERINFLLHYFEEAAAAGKLNPG